MQAWGLSDVGNVRTQNQDTFRIDRISDRVLLAVVCDGMGGAKSGNVASRLAGEVFSEEVLRSFRKDATGQETEQMLLAALKLANISVYEMIPEISNAVKEESKNNPGSLVRIQRTGLFLFEYFILRN